MSDKKNEWIAALSPGKSFMDVGGLWGTTNEKVSVAIRAGAAKATMADITPLDHPQWTDFDRHCAALGVSGYGKLRLDIVEPGAEADVFRHDVVHCSGIIYHQPDPYRTLANLRRIATDHLIVTSMVVPERISNRAGQLDFPADRAAFVPSLSETTRAIVAEHFTQAGVSVGAITQPLEEAWLWPDGSPNLGPWWWLMSPSYLRGLATAAGFVVEDECWSWEGLSYSFLLRAPHDGSRRLPPQADFSIRVVADKSEPQSVATSVREEWQAGVQNEIDFWRSVFTGIQFPEFKRDMMHRLDPATPIPGHIARYLPTDIPMTEIRILDVAAGPISCLGWHVGGRHPKITAIDALAVQYRAILDEFKLTPPVFTEPCDGENISELFAPDSFDLVHIRNALDHCYDAVSVMRNMLAVLKPGGALIVCGHTDEAVFEEYVGLHQWNVRADDGRMIVWRPGERHDINSLFASQLASVEANQDDKARWTTVVLRKK